MKTRRNVFKPNSKTAKVPTKLKMDSGITFNVLKMILTPEGRIVRNESSSYDPQYFLRDYLGNTRVVFRANSSTGSVESIQEDHFDPFGMKLGMGNLKSIELTKTLSAQIQ